MRLLRYWLPAMLWSAVILAASSDLFSSQHTGSLLEDVITRFLGHPLSRETFDLLHAAVRKTGHLTAYGILGGLWFRAVRAGRRSWAWQWAMTAVLLSAAVASIDEWHQSFIPTRTGSPVDVLIDSVGATIAQLVARMANSR